MGVSDILGGPGGVGGVPPIPPCFPHLPSKAVRRWENFGRTHVNLLGLQSLRQNLVVVNRTVRND